jgi:hypothetical protein
MMKTGARRSGDLWLLGLLGVIAVLHLATPPKLFYPGDNFAPRAEAAHLINRGELGFDDVFRPILRDLVAQRGQYFFENDKRQRLASKYGLANTLAYLPPLLVEKAIHGELAVISTRPSLLRILNVYHTLLVLGAAAYLYGIAGRFAGEGGRARREGWRQESRAHSNSYSEPSPAGEDVPSPGRCSAAILAAQVQAGSLHYRSREKGLHAVGGGLPAFFVLVAFYTSYAWYYLRAPALEIYQFLPFFGFVYHGLKGLDAQGRTVMSCKHFAVAILYAGVLMLLKPLYVLLLVPLWGAVLWSERKAESGKREERGAGTDLSPARPEGSPYLCAGGATLLVLAVLLAANAWRYGSPFETGYGQWLNADGSVNTRISPLLFWKGFSGLFLQPTNGWNVFVYAPLFLFALFGIPRFARRHGAAAGFVLAVGGILLGAVCCTAAWTGALAYGPRYALFAALLLSLPVLEVIPEVRGQMSEVGTDGDRLTITDYDDLNRRPVSSTDFVSDQKKAAYLLVLPLMALILAASLWLQANVILMPYLAPDYVRPAFDPLSDQEAVQGYFTAPSRRFHQGMIYRDLLAHRRGRRAFPPLSRLRESGWADANTNAFALLQSHVDRMAAWNVGW